MIISDFTNRNTQFAKNLSLQIIFSTDKLSFISHIVSLCWQTRVPSEILLSVKVLQAKMPNGSSHQVSLVAIFWLSNLYLTKTTFRFGVKTDLVLVMWEQMDSQLPKGSHSTNSLIWNQIPSCLHLNWTIWILKTGTSSKPGAKKRIKVLGKKL